MSTYNTYNDIQAYEALEKRRAEIQLDPQYQQWVRDLRVSQSYVEPSGFIKAKELNNQYDYSNGVSKSSFLNFLKIKGIW
jgi:hypothetical protein